MRTKLLFLAVLFSMQINAQCWSKIASGQYHTLAIAYNGTLWAWGANNYGQLGDGTTIFRDHPVQIGTDANWGIIEAGYNHSLAIKTDGTLYTWGRNSTGQLGIGNTNLQTQPYQNYNISQVMAVAAGESFSLAIKTDGTLWAWGDNSVYQLGDGTTIQKNAPVQIGTATDWAQIAAGRKHSIALKTNQKLYSWGYNGYGQIGNSSMADVSSPINIATTSNWKKISGSLNTTFAIKSDDTLWVWGLSTPVNSTSPQQFGIPHANWANVKGGSNHTVAVKTDGTLWTWGTNLYGEISQPSYGSASNPIQFGSGTNWSTNISCNLYSSFVLDTNGTLYNTGLNDNNQLGSGDTINKSVFSAITCPSVLGVTDFEKKNTIEIYPNPVNDLLNLAVKNGSDIQKVTIFDIAGKQVKQQVGNLNAIAVGDLTSGFYLLEITIDGKKEIKKFLKQ
jgi:alpha-tubulin suppressor-like RCC1 family protein